MTSMILRKWLPLACCSVWITIGVALPAEAAQKPLSPTHLTSASLLDITIDEVISLFEAGSWTSVKLVTVSLVHTRPLALHATDHICQAHLDRIAEVNHILRAVTEVNPDALSIAKALDDERASGRVRG
jgi:amidase